jgi:hypothetical protein
VFARVRRRSCPLSLPQIGEFDSLNSQGAAGSIWDWCLLTLRKLTVRPPIQLASGFLFPNAAPLLEEERHLHSSALSPNAANPIRGHWTRAWPALATDNDPVNALDVHLAKVFEQGFD